MTRQHRDTVRDVEPLHGGYKDYTQAFLARTNNARHPPERSPRPLLQPVREEGHEIELHQLSFDAENQWFAGFAGEKAPVSVWSGTTAARTIFDDSVQTAQKQNPVPIPPSETLLDSQSPAKNKLDVSRGSRSPLRHLSKQLVGKLSKRVPTFPKAASTDYTGTKRKTGSQKLLAKPATRAQSRLVPIADKGRESNNDDSYEGGDNCDAGERKRRKEIPSGAALRQRYLACPYSKHDICRYSPANFTEKRYRGCSKCLFPDISRLKSVVLPLYRSFQVLTNTADNTYIEFISVLKITAFAVLKSSTRVSCWINTLSKALAAVPKHAHFRRSLLLGR
jgi:hypothetical protein